MSIGVADYAAMGDGAKKNTKQLETTNKGQESGINKEKLNIDNLDNTVVKLLQGKKVNEIKITQNDNFRIDLKQPTSLNQVMIRAETLAKLFVIFNKEEYQNLVNDRMAQQHY